MTNDKHEYILETVKYYFGSVSSKIFAYLLTLDDFSASLNDIIIELNIDKQYINNALISLIQHKLIYYDSENSVDNIVLYYANPLKVLQFTRFISYITDIFNNDDNISEHMKIVFKHLYKHGIRTKRN